MKSAVNSFASVGTSEVREGQARLLLPLSGGKGVFYNPRMSLNRDFAVLFATSYFPTWRQVRICDPMAGSGVRAVRYLLESPNVTRVVAADKDSEAVEAARRTVQLNGLESKITVFESDANLLLVENMRDRFDLVDLDPFGSPAPFFESALRATLDGGIIAATATDMGPLTGARPAACLRKYGATSARTEFEKEVAVRILAGCMAGIAGRLELGVAIVFAHASDHYARIYGSMTKGKASSNQTAKLLGFMEYCPKCLTRNSASSLESIQRVCRTCGSQAYVCGPIWLGPLWDGDTVQKMIQNTPPLASSRLSEIQTILSRIADELAGPAFYYKTDAFARALRIKPPGIIQVLDALRECGLQASRTHFDSNGFRTEAKIEELTSLLRRFSEEA